MYIDLCMLMFIVKDDSIGTAEWSTFEKRLLVQSTIMFST